MATTTERTELIPDLVDGLVDWDRVPDPMGDPEDEPETTCELWDAYRACVVAAANGKELEGPLGELRNLLGWYLPVHRLPVEMWYGGGRPESWAELNDVVSCLPEHTRDGWSERIGKAIDELRNNLTPF